MNDKIKGMNTNTNKNIVILYLELVFVSCIISIISTYVSINIFEIDYDYISKNSAVTILLFAFTIIYFFAIPFGYNIFKRLTHKRVKTNIRSIDEA